MVYPGLNLSGYTVDIRNEGSHSKSVGISLYVDHLYIYLIVSVCWRSFLNDGGELHSYTDNHPVTELIVVHTPYLLMYDP